MQDRSADDDNNSRAPGLHRFRTSESLASTEEFSPTVTQLLAMQRNLALNPDLFLRQLHGTRDRHSMLSQITAGLFLPGSHGNFGDAMNDVGNFLLKRSLEQGDVVGPDDKAEPEDRSVTKLDDLVARKRKPDDGSVNGDQPLPKISSHTRRSPG